MLTMKAQDKTNLTFICAVIVFANAASQAAQARNNIELTDGKGETVVVKQGLFGNNTYAAQDRLGNKVVSKKGLFGTKSKGVSILGNTVETKKGLFGSKSYSGTTILGDKFETKRTWFGLGPRKTTVDLSGVSTLANQLVKKRSTTAAAPVSVTDPTTASDATVPPLDTTPSQP
jgi:hypothetical protein